MKIRILYVAVLFVLFNSIVKGQNNAPPLPQRTVNLTLGSSLNFGEFMLVEPIATNVVISSDGSQVPNSNVVFVNSTESYSKAVLTFHLCPGRSITINWTPSFTMTSNEGAPSAIVLLNDVKVNSMTLTNGQNFMSNKGCADTHTINMGGAMVLNAATTYHGIYTGNFSVTVNYQ